MVEYIHYGSSSFDKSLFNIVHNEVFTKPSGGFWASPLDAQKSWKDFVINAGLQWDLSVLFHFRLSKEEKILHLRRCEDLELLPKFDTRLPNDLLSLIFLDFEKLAKQYDSIELHYSESIKNDFYLNSNSKVSANQYFNPFHSLKKALDGWDCDSILIMNPNVIL